MPSHLHSNGPMLSPWGGRLLLISLGLHGLMLGVTVPDLLPSPDHPEVSPAPSLKTAAVSLVSLPPPGRSPVVGKPQPLPKRAPTGSIQTPARGQLSRSAPPPSPSLSAAPSPPLDTPDPAPIQGFTYNHQPQATAADLQQFLTWYLQQDWGAGRPAPQPGTQTLPPLVVTYPPAQCLSPPPGSGRLEIIVNADGSLVRPPRLLASTGYDALDRLGVEQAASQVFTAAANPSSPNPTLYWLTLQVDDHSHSCPAPR